MDLVLRNRRFNEDDLTLIRRTVDQHRSRRLIGEELCRQWQWVYPNGAPKLVACWEALRRLEAKGLISLPPRRGGSTAPKRKWRLALSTGSPVRQLSLPLNISPGTITPLVSEGIHWRLAIAGPLAVLYRELMQAHHYLGYRPAIGQSLRYIAYRGERPIGCLGWCAAAWKVAVRDRWIGWSETARRTNLSRVVNNTRFLILEQRPHLASHLLGSNVRRLAQDWQTHFGYRPVLLETFVDTTRFKGTCYKAANWKMVGHTQGRGKYDRYTRRAETIKAVFVYSLIADFRSVLCHE
jgi:hypothetical protein